MATLEELYTTLRTDGAVASGYFQACNSDEELAAFLLEHGCDADVEEAKAFLAEKSEPEIESTEIKDEELDRVTGGWTEIKNPYTCTVCGGNVWSRMTSRIQWWPPAKRVYHEFLQCESCGETYEYHDARITAQDNKS